MRNVTTLIFIMLMSDFSFCQNYEATLDFNNKKIKCKDRQIKISIIGDENEQIYFPMIKSGEIMFEPSSRLNDAIIGFSYKKYRASFIIKSFDFTQDVKLTFLLNDKKIRKNVDSKMQLIIQPIEEVSNIILETIVRNKRKHRALQKKIKKKYQ